MGNLFVKPEATSSQTTWKKFENWCRLSILMLEGGESVCKKIVYTNFMVPEKGKEMYDHLEQFKAVIEKKKMYAYQRETLLPTSKVIDTTKLDIPLFTLIIEILDDPHNRKYPSIEKLKHKRNEIFHMAEDKRNMSQSEFDKQWNDLSQLLLNLDNTFDMTSLNSFKCNNLYSNQVHKKTLEDILIKGIGTFVSFFYSSFYFSQFLIPTTSYE